MENILYDLKGLEKVTGGDKNFMEKMIALFLEHTPDDIKAMETAIIAKDYPTVSSRAHKVKPSIKYICRSSMYEEVLAIELWEENDDIMTTRTEQFVSDLKMVIDQLRDL